MLRVLHAIWEPAQSADCMGPSMQSADCMVRSLQTAWSPCRLKTPQKLAIFFSKFQRNLRFSARINFLTKLPYIKENNLCLFDNGYYSFSCLLLGETMTSLFARSERLLWRTRFSTTEMPSQFLTQYNTIKSWQFSLFSLKLSLQSTHHCNGSRAVCARFPDCMEHAQRQCLSNSLSLFKTVPHDIKIYKLYHDKTIFTLGTDFICF